MNKIPAFQFYPADWRKDVGVQSLNFHDRGVWFEILCLMHESEDRGKLILNGHPMTEEMIARLLGLDKQVFSKTLAVLLNFGVCSRDSQGVIALSRINRRNRYIYRERPGIALPVRREVLAAGCCNYCGAIDNLTIDHIMPYSRGGEHALDNFQCLCWKCNRAKSDKTEKELFGEIAS